MISPINWKDHIVEHPDWYTETDIGNGVVQHTKNPGTVIQQGTPVNASHLNYMEAEGLEGIYIALIMAQYVNQLSQKVDGLEGTQIEVTMKNTQKYPFNNSKQSVKLPFDRNSKDYTVEVEVIGKTGAGVGDVIVSEKLVNGFKIEFTGAASEVKAICTVRGGI